jgi:hypothetical protein
MKSPSLSKVLVLAALAVSIAAPRAARAEGAVPGPTSTPPTYSITASPNPVYVQFQDQITVALNISVTGETVFGNEAFLLSTSAPAPATATLSTTVSTGLGPAGTVTIAPGTTPIGSRFTVTILAQEVDQLTPFTTALTVYVVAPPESRVTTAQRFPVDITSSVPASSGASGVLAESMVVQPGNSNCPSGGGAAYVQCHNLSPAQNSGYPLTFLVGGQSVTLDANGRAVGLVVSEQSLCQGGIVVRNPHPTLPGSFRVTVGH